MAVTDQLDYSIDSNAFRNYTIAKATDPANTFNKDNLVMREMYKNVYHFSQSKADHLPRLLSELPDLRTGDVFLYKRHSHMNWVSKTKAAATTPYQSREIDQRAIVPQVLHTAYIEDIDYARKTPIEITAATQMEFMYSLSRAKERLAQFGATQTVTTFTDTVVSGYNFQDSAGTAALGDDQLQVIIKDPSTAPVATNAQTRNIGNVANKGSDGDDFVDDLQDYVASLNQSEMQCVLVCHHSVRRHLKKIESYRDRESWVSLGGNENAQMFHYKGFYWLFLFKDVYLNQASKFQGKYYNKDGKIVSAATSGYIRFPTTLPASGTNDGHDYKTMLLINTTGLGWGVDSGAVYSGSAIDSERSFATVRYMKAGYGAGRKDEAKVSLILYRDVVNPPAPS